MPDIDHEPRSAASRRRWAGIVALVCLLALVYQAYLGGQVGGLAPEFFLLLAFSLIFGALWFSLGGRRR